jgi:hypothetical protein
LGDNIREWKKVLGGAPREFSGYDTSFTWDTLGLELVNDPKNKTRVIQMTLFLNFRPKDPYEGLVTHLPDGTPVQPLPDFKPHSAFAGYLELDGAGIDRDTQVWEVNALAKREKKISCMSSLNKCHAGAENDDDHIVSFATDARKDRGLIYQFTIYR